MGKMNKVAQSVLPITLSMLLVTPPVVGSAQSSNQANITYKDWTNLLSKEKQQEISFTNIKQEKEQTTKNEYIIKTDKPIASSVHKKAGATVVKSYSKLGFDVIRITDEKKLEAAIKVYKKIEGVRSISKSVSYEKLAVNDPKVDKQYHVEQLELLQAQDQASDSEVTVAVIDGGVDLKHKDLKNNIVGAINILDPMKKPVADAHGTHVAGIIAAEKNNGIGGIGVNPSANLLAIDVFNGTPFTSDYHIAEGIIYAVDNGANVINMSLGGGFPSDILDSAIQYAVESGVVVVAAAGNSGSNQKEYPASYDSVISVGATNADEELADFSTFGPSVDVVAPGQDIYSTGYWNKSTYMNMSGTSMASPVVAGVVSLLLADNPDLTPSEIEYILKNTSKDLGESGYDLKYAHGLVDPGEALSFEGDFPVSYELYPEEGLEVAESLTLKDDQASANGSLTLEESQSFYTVDVKEGEYVQTLLQGDKNVDYKLGIYFFDQDGEWMDMLELDDAREGSKEGYLYQAMTDGTILLEVKDSNKNLGVNGKASFTLDVMVTDELLDEGNSESTPTLVEELPYVLEEPAYLAGEDGDSDFYTFSVSEEQTVKVELDGVPGIDPAIKLWITEDGTEEKFEMLWEDLGYSGEGETLIFDAIPGYTYTAELMSAPYFSEDDEIFEDEFFEIDFGFYGGLSSLLPYTVTIDGKVIPEDADGFPEEYMDEEELLLSGSLSLKEYAKKSISRQDEEDEHMDEEEYEEELYNPFSGALPITLGDDVTDYLQFGGDVDIFSFTATDNVSAKLAVTSQGKLNPLVELYAFDEQFGEWALVQMSIGLYSMQDHIMANLVEGTDYVVAVSDLNWMPSFDSYTVSTEIMGSYEQDEFEPNNLDVQAYDLGEETVSGNLTASGDVDLFYLPPGESGVWGFHTSVTPDPSSKLPLDPVVIVLADINGDKVLDWEEFESQQVYDTGFENESESGSFMRKEEAGQFIVVLNYFGGANVNSTSTYELITSPIASEDEDENSVVKGNVPSHPLALKKQGQTWSAKGYFNSKSLSDDMDWYVLPTWENTRATLSLKAPGTDATMKVYDSKGQQLASVDDYGKDDHEVRAFTLGKGPYYVSVTTYDGNGSLLPYELNVTSNVTPKNGKERISGNTRYETSLAFAKKIADHSLDTVILASGENYPDALAGGPLAESLNGTVILVNEKTSVLEAATKEAQRLLKSNGKIVILGGTKAVSKEVESQLKKKFKVTRMSGSDRTDTSLQIASKVNKAPTEIFLTSGSSFADALSVSSYATTKQIPILLNSSKDELHKDIKEYIKKSKVKTVTIVGGTSVVSDQVKKELQSLGVTVNRIAGKDRIETSVKVAETYYSNATSIAVTNGWKFPDALSGSHFASVTGSPVVLTDGKKLGSQVEAYMKKNKISSYYIYGGTAVMSDTVVK